MTGHRLTYRLRAAEPSDHRAITDLQSILSSTASDGASWPPTELLEDTDTESWVADRDERIIGVGIGWRNAFHPRRRRVSLGVHPDHRRRGIARALWDRLDADPSNDWQTAVDATNLAGRAFLDRLGFGQIMRTHLGRHRPTGHGPPRKPLPDGWELVVLSQAPPAMRDDEALARLHRDIYTEQHTWDPPIAFPDAEALCLFVRRPGGELRAENTVLAVHGGVPLGVGSLRGDAFPGTMELGWIGVLEHAGANGPQVSMALTDWCLVRAARLGVAVDIEVDDANAPVLEALGAWGVEWDPAWWTFARDQRAQS